MRTFCSASSRSPNELAAERTQGTPFHYILTQRTILAHPLPALGKLTFSPQHFSAFHNKLNWCCKEDPALVCHQERPSKCETGRAVDAKEMPLAWKRENTENRNCFATCLLCWLPCQRLLRPDNATVTLWYVAFSYCRDIIRPGCTDHCLLVSEGPRRHMHCPFTSWKPWLECGMLVDAIPCDSSRALMLRSTPKKMADVVTVLFCKWLFQFRRVCKVGVPVTAILLLSTEDSMLCHVQRTLIPSNCTFSQWTETHPLLSTSEVISSTISPV
jgi:hypothetical protein